MSGAAARAAPAGLHRLIEDLRAAGFPIGAGEMLDAALLLRRLAESDEATVPSRAGLRLKLRPVLCKSHAEFHRFDRIFAAWAEGLSAPIPAAASHPEQSRAAPTDREPAAPPLPAAAAANHPARRSRSLLAVAAVALLALLLWVLQRQSVQPRAGAGASEHVAAAGSAAGPGAPSPTASARDGRTAAPGSAPAAVAPGPSPEPGGTGSAVPPVLPSLPSLEPLALRLPWLLLLLTLPLAGLLAAAWRGRAALPRIGRRSGDGALTLEAWPAARQMQLLTQRLAADAEGRLQRHLRGPATSRLAYARRPRLDLRRTVAATVADGGVPRLRWRFARLRPSYLVLVDATRDDDLGVLWAQRLAALDMRVEIYRFDAGAAQPLCIELGGGGRRLPFAALSAPGPEQRLILVMRASRLFAAGGRLHHWARGARLERYAARALFDPDEPRDWNAALVDRLEAAIPGDPGMTVLPFEDNALEVWSAWLVQGVLPPVALAEPQLFPRLLHGGHDRFVGDRRPEELDPDSKRAARIGQQLVSQLQSYLGQNGFYWLCACAVPPLLEPGLAMLLGEEYFRRCGADEAGTANYMARSWRLLVRLPWLHPGPDGSLPPLPQWLRLALLARLTPALQDELREVVRGALARRGGGQARGLKLAFDWDPQVTPVAGGQAATPAHALLLGFARDGFYARELMIRMPGDWTAWLGSTPAPRRRAELWHTVRRRNGATGIAPAMTLLAATAAATLLAALMLGELATISPPDVAAGWRGLWLAPIATTTTAAAATAAPAWAAPAALAAVVLLPALAAAGLAWRTAQRIRRPAAPRTIPQP